ncbi:pyridoxamine 5'-phosphate oxidase [soil metagenome]
MAKNFAENDWSDPIALFQTWMDEAGTTELNDPNAVALATATADGAPSVRMVLLKQLDERGFAFFTNAESEKGRQLAENAQAAMCFHWKSQRRQVRVEGSVSELSSVEADNYFHSRSRRSQLGAAASHQSQVLESREQLEDMVRKLAEEFPGEIPRPAYWKGFVLAPWRIEFWQDGADRLHDRMLFERQGDGWVTSRLFP